jgi:hypothetical protein
MDVLELTPSKARLVLHHFKKLSLQYSTLRRNKFECCEELHI